MQTQFTFQYRIGSYTNTHRNWYIILLCDINLAFTILWASSVVYKLIKLLPLPKNTGLETTLETICMWCQKPTLRKNKKTYLSMSFAEILSKPSMNGFIILHVCFIIVRYKKVPYGIESYPSWPLKCIFFSDKSCYHFKRFPKLRLPVPSRNTLFRRPNKHQQPTPRSTRKKENSTLKRKMKDPVSILYKSIAGRYWLADGPITTRYRLRVLAGEMSNPLFW